MAVESPGQRPIFASEETDYLTPAKPPTSRLAVAGLLLGLLSALAVFNIDLIVLPILAVAISLAAYWHIGRTESLSGRMLALAGVALGVAFGAWTITAVRLRDQYLYEVASQFAREYLEVVSENQLLEAFELMQPETARQVAGTSLEEHYQNVGTPEQSALSAFKDDPKTKAVVARGPGADWQLKSGVRVEDPHGGLRRVRVLMVDVSQTPGIEAEVTLARERNAGDGGTGSASWYVVGMK